MKNELIWNFLELMCQSRLTSDKRLHLFITIHSCEEVSPELLYSVKYYENDLKKNIMEFPRTLASQTKSNPAINLLHNSSLSIWTN